MRGRNKNFRLYHSDFLALPPLFYLTFSFQRFGFCGERFPVDNFHGRMGACVSSPFSTGMFRKTLLNIVRASRVETVVGTKKNVYKPHLFF